MSKFWARPGEESSDESEVEEEEDHEEEEKEVKQSAAGRKRWLLDDFSDDEGKRVVKDTRTKRFEELETIVSNLKNHMKINDWIAIQEEFDKLNGQLKKMREIIEKDGIPQQYIKAIVSLEDFVNKTVALSKEVKQKMSPSNHKAFNTMKQKIRKNNKQYEKEIAAYKATAKTENEEARSDEEKASEEELSEEEVAPAKEPVATAKRADSDEWGSGDEGTGSEPEAETTAVKGRGRDFWKKKDVEEKVVSKKEKKKAEREKRKGGAADTSGSEGESEEEEPRGPAHPPAEPKPIEWTAELVDQKLKEVASNRGKKGTSPLSQLEKLDVLEANAKSEEQRVAVLMVRQSVQLFDVPALYPAHAHLPVDTWRNAAASLAKLLDCLEAHPEIVVAEPDVVESEREAEEREEAAAAGSPAPRRRLIAGNLLAFIERLDDEFTRSLQYLDPHTQGYVQRLTDEPQLLALMARIQAYYERTGVPKKVARVALRRIEHLYHKRDTLVAAPAHAESSDQLLSSLAALVYAHGDEQLKARTMLCQVYHHALHDRFYEARDMLLLSHLQDNIIAMDVPTQILFNRAMVQLGLCAFRCGLISEAHSCLSEICQGGRVRELLAQGLTSLRYGEKNPEQERAERRRQVPYHMHINMELLEAFHLISAMLLEVPNLALAASAVGDSGKKKVVSKPFRRLLEFYDQQVFTGPPETTRDHVVAAAKALARGEWRKCEALLLGLPIWSLVPNCDVVKAMLRRKIQEEGLRTYLFSFSGYYDSLSLQQLADMFELPKNTVHSLVSKMMISEELHASWDQPSGSVVMHRVEPSRIQALAMQFAEKAAVFVEHNELLLDSRTGALGGASGAASSRGDFKGGKKDQYTRSAKAKGEGRWKDSSMDRGRRGQAGRYGQQSARSSAPYLPRAGREAKSGSRRRGGVYSQQ